MGHHRFCRTDRHVIDIRFAVVLPYPSTGLPNGSLKTSGGLIVSGNQPPH